MDRLLGRKPTPGQKPPDCVGRYLVTKISWRGSYTRVMCVCLSGVHTQDPSRALALTNSYSLAGEAPDVESVALGADGAEFVISARQDARSKYKPLRFSCQQRALLLSDLLQCVEAAAALGRCPLAPRLLGPSQEWACMRYWRGAWAPATLRVSATGVEAVEAGAREPRWRIGYHHLASPGVVTLQPSRQPDGSEVTGVFAFMSRVCSTPEVYAAGRGRDALLGALQSCARKRVGVQVTMDGSGAVTADALLESVTTEERALASELPLGQWQVERLSPAFVSLPPQAAQAAPHLSGRRVALEALAAMGGLGSASGGAHLTPRRAVVTPSSLVEREVASHEVVARDALTNIAALVRFVEDPQLLGIEWEDGAPPRQYVTPEREELVACLLDAAQTAAARPVPVLAGWTHPGDVIITARKHASHAPHTERDADLQALSLAALEARARQAGPTLASHANDAWQANSAPSPSPHALAADSPHSSLSAASGGTGAFGGGAGGRGDAPLSPAEAAECLMEAVYETNANLPYSGLAPDSDAGTLSAVGGGGGGADGPGVLGALAALLPAEGAASVGAWLGPDEAKQVVAVLQCLQRLCSSTSVAEALLNTPGALGRVFSCLGGCASPSLGAGVSAGGSLAAAEAVAAEAARLLLRLWAPAAARVGAPPWRLRVSAPMRQRSASDAAAAQAPLIAAPGPADLHLSRVAKLLSFSSVTLQLRVAALLAPLGPPTAAAASSGRSARGGAPPPRGGADGSKSAGPRGRGGALLAMAVVEALGALAAEPGASNSDPALQQAVLQGLSNLGRPLFGLFAHPAGRVADGTAVLTRAVAQVGAASAAPMREAALKEGALLQHLHQALLAQGPKQELSQELVACWADEYAPALALLRRTLPPGLIRYLNTPRAAAAPAPAASAPPPSAEAPTLAMAALPGAAEASLTQAPPQQLLTSRLEPPSAAGAASPTSVAAAAAVPLLGAATAPGAAPGALGPLGGSQLPAAAVAAGRGADASPLTGRSPSGVGSVIGAGVPSAAAPAHGSVAAAGAPSAAPAAAAPGASSHPGPGVPGTAGSAAGVAPVAPSAAQQPPPPPLLPKAASFKCNWEALWAAAGRDHCHAGLIWNESTRLELRDALGSELSGLRARRQRVAQGSGGWPSWNHAEFTVTYPSLAAHHAIGGVYVRLLLEGADAAAVEKLAAPKDFFHAAYHAALAASAAAVDGDTPAAPVPAGARLAPVPGWGGATVVDPAATQQLCVRAMAAVYSAHAGVIGAFEGMGHLLSLLDNTRSRPLRHCLLLLLQALICPRVAAPLPRGMPPRQQQLAAARAARANGYALLDRGGLALLVDLVAAAHEQGERCAVGAGAAAAREGGASSAPTAFITAISNAEAPREWYYYPQGVLGTGAKAPSAPPPPALAAAAVPTDDAGRAGPVSRAELKHAFHKGAIGWATPVWAAGMAAPLPLARVRELRWSLAGGGPGLFSPFEAAGVALGLLQALADMQPAVDDTGCPLQPLPRTHAALAGPELLPHIAQVMLTGEPALVAASARLLTTCLAGHEAALPRLYATGAFYFALAYCGSNLAEVSELFRVGHLRQHFRGPADLSPGAPLGQRSYLGAVLPESLLHTLGAGNGEAPAAAPPTGSGGSVTAGAARFAEALAGEHDSPELIWTSAMRFGRLVPAVLQHLGDLPHRLAEHCHAVYDYAPIPPLAWPELEGEMWCHRYYLRNLCDETRFAGWPIVDHIPLLQALLEQWRAEMARKPLGMSEAEACRALGLDASPPGGVVSEEDMRRAYRALARKYHPDKNPAGRVQFLAVQAAYERLQAGAAGGQGPQGWRIELMLRAQCILFKRYGHALSPFKYAGYPQLLGGLRAALDAGAQPASASAHSDGAADGTAAAAAADGGGGPAPAAAAPAADSGGGGGGGSHFLSAQLVGQVAAAAQLTWLTCCSSQLNAQELVRAGGVGVLAALLGRCCGVMPLDVAPTAPVADVATHVLRSLVGVAAVEVAWPELIANTALLRDIVRCCALERCPSAVDAALLAICHMAASPQLQALLLEAGAVPYLVPLLLQYDTTLPPETTARLALPFSPDAAAAEGDGAAGGACEGFAILDSSPVRASMAEAASQLALLAARALARLAGLLPPPHATPAHAGARAALRALLTESLAARLAEADPAPLLGLLSASLETSDVIWNGTMRAELASALGEARAAADGGGDAARKALAALDSFRFASLQGELQVAGVFVRVFIQRARAGAPAAGSGGAASPAASVRPSDPAAFCKGLVRFAHGALVERAFRGAELWRLAPRERRDLREVLAALQLLLAQEPRLLGLLASKSALAPLLAALAPAAAAGAAAADAGGARDAWPGDAGAAAAAAAAAAAGAAGAAEASPPGAAAPTPAQAAQALRDDAEALALCSASLLGRCLDSAGCAALAIDEPLLRTLLSLTAAAPSARVQAAALTLLRAIVPHPLASQVAGFQGGGVLLASVALHQGAWPWQAPDEPPGKGEEGGEAAAVTAAQGAELRAAALAVLGKLMGEATHGPRVAAMLVLLLPQGLVAAVAEGPPEAALKLLDSSVDSPECLWDTQMAAAAAAEAATFATSVRAAHAAGRFEWAPPPPPPGGDAAEGGGGLPPALRSSRLAGELFVGGVYVRRFMKDPRFGLRDPKRFAEALAERFLQELGRAAGAGGGAGASSSSSSSEAALLLSAAAVALLQGHPLLADHLAALGYCQRLLAALASRTGPPPTAATAAVPAATPATAGEGGKVPPAGAVEVAAQQPPDELGGSLLRLIHQLSTSSAACESLASPGGPPVVGTVVAAMVRWGPGAAVLALETLHRLLAGAVRQREALVGQAMSVQLPARLLAVLDWHSGRTAAAGGAGDEGADGAVLRAVAVDVLKGLAAGASEGGGGGGFSAQVAALLASSPVWAAYRDQRHDMFLPSGASAQGGVVGLLTGGEAARFALPPPALLNGGGGEVGDVGAQGGSGAA